MDRLNLFINEADGRIFFKETDPELKRFFGDKAFLEEEYLDEEDEEYLNSIYNVRRVDAETYMTLAANFMNKVENKYRYNNGQLAVIKNVD